MSLRTCHVSYAGCVRPVSWLVLERVSRLSGVQWAGRGERDTHGLREQAERQRGREAMRQRGNEAERQRGRETERQSVSRWSRWLSSASANDYKQTSHRLCLSVRVQPSRPGHRWSSPSPSGVHAAAAAAAAAAAESMVLVIGRSLARRSG